MLIGGRRVYKHLAPNGAMTQPLRTSDDRGLSSSLLVLINSSLTGFSGRAYSLRAGFRHDTQALLLPLLVRLYLCFSYEGSVRAKLA